MRKHSLARVLTGLICSWLLASSAINSVRAQTLSHASPATAPRVFMLDAHQLQDARRRIHAGDKSLSPALDKLRSEAKKALTAGPFSVTTKGITPPSNDKHDYMSQAPYFWPDPKKPDGLPYIRRDGERNPEINKITDHQSMDKMISAVDTLSLAYYFDGDEAYASRAAELLRAFFLDPATKMNPNLRYAQGIPGINTGRGIGLIETVGLTKVVDSIGLLAASKSWTDADQHGLQDWFAKFLQWMLESKNGRDEAAAKNNHGTHYDLQVTSFALFLAKNDLAANVLRAAREKRIAKQIEPDGRQPLELERTKAWSYSVYNLQGLMSLATLGERVGVDLWGYRTEDGRNLRRALEYLAPFGLGEQKWTYKQIGEWHPEILFPLLRIAQTKYPDQQIRALAAKAPRVDPADRSNLVHPNVNESNGRLIGPILNQPDATITAGAR
jgi:hypothetical protein